MSITNDQADPGAIATQGNPRSHPHLYARLSHGKRRRDDRMDLRPCKHCRYIDHLDDQLDGYHPLTEFDHRADDHAPLAQS